MKPFFVLALALAAVLPAHAQGDDIERAERVERERIDAERKAADARFAERRKECNARFAVTDCLRKAERERSATLGDLRRQERVLNDAERKRRGAERLRDQAERNSPERQRDEQERRAKAVEEQKGREAQAAEKAQKRAEQQAERASAPRRAKSHSGASGPQGKPREARAPKGPTITAEEAAKNRAVHDKRVQEAEAHKAEVQARVAKRAKPAASSLPVPK
jgi:colicin import membrane protein